MPAKTPFQHGNPQVPHIAFGTQVAQAARHALVPSYFSIHSRPGIDDHSEFCVFTDLILVTLFPFLEAHGLLWTAAQAACARNGCCMKLRCPLSDSFCILNWIGPNMYGRLVTHACLGTLEPREPNTPQSRSMPYMI